MFGNIRIRILVTVIMLSISSVGICRETTKALGVGVRYGGLIGGQVGVIEDRYKLNGSAGLLGGGVGLEVQVFPYQSLGLSAAFIAFGGLVGSVDYNLYLSQSMFRGVCITLSYENWQGEYTSEQYVRGSVGYHF